MDDAEPGTDPEVTEGAVDAPADRDEPSGAPLSLEVVKVLADRHGPQNWREYYEPEVLRHMIESGHQVPMVVLAADIRKSTYLMKEATSPQRYAETVGVFVEFVKEVIQEAGGWFDKFTGDGFLAYWWPMAWSLEGEFPSESPSEQADDGEDSAGDLPAAGSDSFIGRVRQAIDTANRLIDIFENITIPQFKGESRNFPNGVGLSMGLDAGDAALVLIADDLTIVGPPVVGAVRMVTSADDPGELVANVYPGELLDRLQARIWPNRDVRVTSEFRPTKEYPEDVGGQEVYPIRFRRRGAVATHRSTIRR